MKLNLTQLIPISAKNTIVGHIYKYQSVFVLRFEPCQTHASNTYNAYHFIRLFDGNVSDVSLILKPEDTLDCHVGEAVISVK